MNQNKSHQQAAPCGCDSPRITPQGGCETCLNCGWSACLI
ncbi:CxxC motif protein [Hardygib1 virus]|nr:CxxC motif protein [Hardygib1 virus]